MEEEYIKNLCAQILKFKPDLVITEKGLSDLAIHYLSKAGVSAIRRLRKTDNNRIAKACGAVIVNRPEELQESDVGTGAGLFEVKKIGDEFFAFIVDCKDPKACTVLLRGASKDVLNEVERNLQVFLRPHFHVFVLLAKIVLETFLVLVGRHNMISASHPLQI
jgi:T-complex protein 1 subunit gamma